MQSDRKNIDNLFGDVLGDFEENLPNNVWDNIENNLDADKKRTRKLFYLSAAASVIILLSFSFGYMVSYNSLIDNMSFISSNAIGNDIEIQNNKVLLSSINSEKPANTVFKSNNNSIKNVSQSKEKINTILSTEINTKNDISNTLNIVDTKVLESNSIALIEKDSEDKTILYEEIIQKNIHEKENLIADNSTQSRWKVAGQFSPSVMYNAGSASSQETTTLVASNQQLSRSVTYTEDVPVSENKNTVSYTTGLNVQYYFTKRFGIQSGMYYSKFNVSSEFLEIPLLANYKIIDRRIDFKVFSGFSSGIFINNETQDDYTPGINPIVGLGLEYEFTKRLTFAIEPSVKYFNLTNTTGYDEDHLFNFGVFTGIGYRF